MAGIRIQLDLTVPSVPARIVLVAALLALCAGDINSESVVMTTYYPAPSGVYTQMLTTGNTWLARDGGALAVGTPATLPSGTKMAVVGGRVGIGNTAPQSALDVSGGVAVGVYAGNGAGSSPAPANGLIVSGNVGINVAAPADRLDVAGNAQVTGNLTVATGHVEVSNSYVHVNESGCSATSGDGTVCPGDYATWTPGIYVEGWSIGPLDTNYYCCAK